MTRKRATPGSATASVALEDALAELHRLHAIGRESLAARPERAVHGAGAIAEEALRRGIESGTLFKLRQFADPNKGYGRAQLGELCDHCRSSGRALGFSLIIRLLSVTDREERLELQRRAVQEGWSKRRLDVEVKRRFGRRQPNGRPRHIASDGAGVLVQLDDLVGSLLHWHRQLEKRAAAGEPGVTVPDLPPEVRAWLTVAVAALRGLETAAKAAVAADAPRRGRSTTDPRPPAGAP